MLLYHLKSFFKKVFYPSSMYANICMWGMRLCVR